MLRKFTKKRVLLVGVASLIVASAAFAYWTTSGDGTGTATTGDASGFTVDQTANSAPTGLVPGGSPQAVKFDVQNNASTPQRIRSVDYSVSSIKKTSDGSAVSTSDCDPDWFTVVDPTVADTSGEPGHDITGGATETFTGSIKLENTNSNQDGCKGVTVTLAAHAS